MQASGPDRRRGLLAIALMAAAVLWGGGNARAFAAGPKRLLAYYTSWSKDRAPAYSAANIPFAKLTHIAHAFLYLDTKADGSLDVPAGLLEPLLISRAHAAGVKVLISIGGASDEQARAFSTIAHDASRTTKFVTNLHAFLTANGYDGVDIDWEVPNAPEDTEAAAALMRALRVELPLPDWIVSMAVTTNPATYGTGLDIPAITPSVDFFNVLTYDYHGPWTDHAGHNSPLYQNAKDPGLEGSIADSIDLYLDGYGVPAEKLNIGTPFYGYEFDEAPRLWGGCGCRTGTTSRDYGTYIKARVNGLGWEARVDKISKAPFLLRTGASGFVTYDDAKSTKRKVTYALGERGLGGVFMWEISGDFDGQRQDLLDAMIKAFNRFRSDRPVR